MKFTNTAKKKNLSKTDTLLNILQLERILSHISCYAALSDLAVCCFSLVLWHCLLTLVFGNDSIIVSLDSGQTIALALTAVLCCLLDFLLKNRLEKNWRRDIFVYLNAEEYFIQSMAGNRHKIILCLMLTVSGFSMSIILPGHLYYSDLRFSLGINAFLISFSAFFLTSILQERHAYRQMNVMRVSDPGNSDEYNHSNKRRHAIIRWSAYRIVVLGGYLSISVLFQSLSMYAGYLIIGGIYFILCLIIHNPFRRFSGIRAKRIPVRLLNTAVVLGMAGLCLYITQNGSDFNNRYIDSLSYEGFRHESAFSYDQETGVYTISASFS